MTERVKVHCPECNKSYRVNPNKIGKNTNCKKCGSNFELEVLAEVIKPPSIPHIEEQGEWHVTIGRESRGPFTISQIVLLIQEGKIKPDTLLWKEGMKDWEPISSIPEFSNYFVVTECVSTPPPIPTSPTQVPTTISEVAPLEPTAIPDDPPSILIAIPNDPLQIFRSTVIAGLHRQRFAVCVLSGLGMLATFLPWVHAPIIGSVSGTAGDGWFTLLLFIPAMVIALRGQKLQPILGNARLGATIPAGIASAIGLLKFVGFKIKMSDAGRNNPFAEVMAASVHIGLGLYLLIAAGAALVVAAWYLTKRPIEIEHPAGRGNFTMDENDRSNMQSGLQPTTQPRNVQVGIQRKRSRRGINWELIVIGIIVIALGTVCLVMLIDQKQTPESSTSEFKLKKRNAQGVK